MLLWREPDLLAKPLATRYSSEVLGDSCGKLVKGIPDKKAGKRVAGGRTGAHY